MRRWQVFSAVALRRLPILMPQMNPIEAKVQRIFDAYEVSKSRLSAHELQHLQDIKAKEDPENEMIAGETAQDKEDRWIKEKSQFTFGKHDERLTLTHYLFMKQKFGTDIKYQWLLPQAAFDDKQDDNLLDTARRALRESLNIKNGYRIVSKVPSAIYSFRYPKKIVELTGGYYGAKVFFLKAHLDDPSSSVLEALDDVKNSEIIRWQTRSEALNSNLNINKRYMDSFSLGLLHEDQVDLNRVLRNASCYATAIRQKSQIQQSIEN